MIENIISDLDMLLIMTVNPGFGGQRFIPEMLSKIAQARQLADEFNPELDIAVDGGIDASTAPSVVEVGANILIAGTAVFGHPDGVVAACNELRDVTARI
jgi:ribulose-phosphate 3-epimerase